MIWTLKVQLMFSIYEANWSGMIEIDCNDSLRDLHSAIINAIEFDDDHLFGFFVSNTVFSPNKLFINANDDNYDDYDGTDTLIKDILPQPGHKNLFYLFDYGDNWTFKVTKSRLKAREPEPGVSYPRLVSEIGDKPVQYPNYEEEDEI